MAKKSFTFNCIVAKQGKHELVCFVAKASQLWNLVEINRREPDKDKGYQRTLSLKRVDVITRYINNGNAIPLNILVSFDKANLNKTKNIIHIPNKKNAGWVIDGQHRLAGAHSSKVDIDLIVICYIGLALEEQIKEFVTINKEAKGVPTSLYLDLLKKLPKNKTEKEIGQERATDIANNLRNDEFSPLFNKIVIMTSPKRGEISLTNFVRKVTPLVQPKGRFGIYTTEEQIGIINNYFIAASRIFPQHFEEPEPIFLQTIGFGALVGFLLSVFDLCMRDYQSFTIVDISALLKKIDDFDFKPWIGLTGAGAEAQLTEELRQALLNRMDKKINTAIKLR